MDCKPLYVDEGQALNTIPTVFQKGPNQRMLGSMQNFILYKSRFSTEHHHGPISSPGPILQLHEQKGQQIMNK